LVTSTRTIASRPATIPSPVSGSVSIPTRVSRDAGRSNRLAGIPPSRGRGAKMSEKCDYGGCDNPAAGGYHVHGSDHKFCEYHLDEVSP